jgi:hypothetical protein
MGFGGPFEHRADPFASARKAALDPLPVSIALHEYSAKAQGMPLACTGSADGSSWKVRD